MQGLADNLDNENHGLIGESCGLAVEHLAHDQKVVGSIPVQC